MDKMSLVRVDEFQSPKFAWCGWRTNSTAQSNIAEGKKGDVKMSNSKTLFVNRNTGAQDWAQKNGFATAEVVESFDPSMIESGDTVVGTLPLPLAAAVHAKGADFIALTMKPVPAALRGTPLSAEQMDELGAAVQSMTVEVVDIVSTPQRSALLAMRVRRSGYGVSASTPRCRRTSAPRIWSRLTPTPP